MAGVGNRGVERRGDAVELGLDCGELRRERRRSAELQMQVDQWGRERTEALLGEFHRLIERHPQAVR